MTQPGLSRHGSGAVGADPHDPSAVEHLTEVYDQAESGSGGPGRNSCSDAYRSIGAVEDALAAVEESTALAPDNPGPVVLRADLLADLGRAEEALPALNDALAKDPNDGPA